MLRKLENLRYHIPTRKEGLRILTEIVGAMPTRFDTKLGILIKTLTAAGLLTKLFDAPSTDTKAYFKHLDLVYSRNRVFTQLFFGTSLNQKFRVRRIKATEDDVYILAELKDDLTKAVVFKEEKSWYSQNSEVDKDFFWHTTHLNLEETIESLWDDYPTGIFVHPAHKSGSRDTDFGGLYLTEIVRTRDDFEYVSDKLNAIIGVCQKAFAMGVSRSYLAHGEPGNGKTTGVLSICRSLGGRLLQIDGECIQWVQAKELLFLVDALKPTVILIDDLDRATSNNGSDKALSVMEHLRGQNHQTIIFVTANNTTAFGDAMLRSERIDECIYFGPPTPHEREALCDRISNDAQRQYVIAETEGFSFANLKSVVDHTIFEGDPRRILTAKQELMKLAGFKKPESAEPSLKA